MRRRVAVLAMAACAGLAGSGVALAQYKVVDAQGRVTYTDTPPPPAVAARVTRLHDSAVDAGSTDAAGPPLPAALRKTVDRYPVVFYATAECAACDAGRADLQRRGIPFDERLIVTAKDQAELTRLTGADDLPALRIGDQALHGFARSVWQSYLSAAGYPEQSVLQADYRGPAAQPLTRSPAPARRAQTAAADVAPVRAPSAPSSAGGIAF